MKSRLINVAHWVTCTGNLGPGSRAVLWVQGCPHRCPGCIAPEWLSFSMNNLFSTKTMASKLLVSDEVNGLTFSGGEPMAQAEALVDLTRQARSLKDLNVICFTGYRYEYLLSTPPFPGISDFLKEIDVLVDGPYIKSLNNGVGLRGSSNQRIIHLSQRLFSYNLEEMPRKVDIFLDENEMRMVGIPPLGMEAMLNPKTQISYKLTDEVTNERL